MSGETDRLYRAIFKTDHPCYRVAQRIADGGDIGSGWRSVAFDVFEGWWLRRHVWRTWRLVDRGRRPASVSGDGTGT